MHYKYCRRGDILNFLFDKKKVVTCDIKSSCWVRRCDLMELLLKNRTSHLPKASKVAGASKGRITLLSWGLWLFSLSGPEETSQTVLSCCGSVGAAVLPTLITAPQTGHPLLQCQSTRTFLVWLLGAPQHVQWARNYHQLKCNNLLTVLSLIVLFMIHINWHLALILSCSPFSEQLLLLSVWSTRSTKSFHRVLRGYIIYFSLRKSARFITLQMHTSQK